MIKQTETNTNLVTSRILKGKVHNFLNNVAAALTNKYGTKTDFLAEKLDIPAYYSQLSSKNLTR